MSLPVLRDSSLPGALDDLMDVMAMDILIDESSSGDVLDEFSIEDINFSSENFDFLDNFQEPHFETPGHAENVTEVPQPSPISPTGEEESSPVYVNVPVKDAVDESKSEDVENQEAVKSVLELPRLIIMKPPLRTVTKKPSKKKTEEMLLLEELEKLSQAEIVIPLIPEKKTHIRERKPNLVSVRKPSTDCATPKKKVHISKAKKQLFPADNNDPPEHEQEITSPKLSAPKEDQEDPPGIHETVVETRRSLRINASRRNKINKEVYFSCDACRKIFKDRKMLLHHRKTHTKVSQ
ncbi:uncharacterized protein LOC129788014 [Lutzomyia longipalpis]|uniref:uncharacterized protein LOC129788014 n=1 Tax=Lutzomyia longipalpis TaxID=7200 RepID=UPI0024833DC6|nr:uncharacterized protein LOC129788014 [Lutzomyia longipalpis]